jgi:hypothetical protein
MPTFWTLTRSCLAAPPREPVNAPGSNVPCAESESVPEMPFTKVPAGKAFLIHSFLACARDDVSSFVGHSAFGIVLSPAMIGFSARFGSFGLAGRPVCAITIVAQVSNVMEPRTKLAFIESPFAFRTIVVFIVKFYRRRLGMSSVQQN